MCAATARKDGSWSIKFVHLSLRNSCLFKYPDLPPGSCCFVRHVSSPAHWSRVWGWYCYPRLSHIKNWAPQRISQCYKQSAEKLPKSIGGSVNHKIWHQPIWSVLRKCLNVLTVMVLCLPRRWLLNAASVSQPAAGRISKVRHYVLTPNACQQMLSLMSKNTMQPQYGEVLKWTKCEKGVLSVTLATSFTAHLQFYAIFMCSFRN